MSNWRDNLRTASFRGIEFEAESHDTTGGRRLINHEYPLRDDNYTEDIGKKTKHFSVPCYVIGSDYMTARDQLNTALDAEGPGALVLPWLGTVMVAVDEYHLKESTKEGGMARFTVQFMLAGQAEQPSAKVDTGYQVAQAADQANIAVTEDFTDVFSTGSVSEWVREAAIEGVESILNEVTEAAGLAAVPVTQLEAMAAQAMGLQADVATLIATPDQLAQRVLSLLTSMLPTIPDISTGLPVHNALNALSPTAEAEAAPSAPVTTGSAIATTNGAALAELATRAAVITQARNAASISFENYEQAMTVRDQLTESLEAHALTAPDALYTTLMDLRVAIVRDITARGADLAHLVKYTPKATLPSLVIAHAIYGDASRETEIVSRNKVRHPGAVPGGQDLEVLTNA